MKSSFGFFSKTKWAREFVEDVYLEMLEDKKTIEKFNSEKLKFNYSFARLLLRKHLSEVENDFVGIINSKISNSKSS